MTRAVFSESLNFLYESKISLFNFIKVHKTFHSHSAYHLYVCCTWSIFYEWIIYTIAAVQSVEQDQDQSLIDIILPSYCRWKLRFRIQHSFFYQVNSNLKLYPLIQHTPTHKIPKPRSHFLTRLSPSTDSERVSVSRTRAHAASPKSQPGLTDWGVPQPEVPSQYNHQYHYYTCAPPLAVSRYDVRLYHSLRI